MHMFPSPCFCRNSNPFLQLNFTPPQLDLYYFGTTIYTCVLFIVTLKLALDTQHWTWFT